jgi:hypothetical protein
MMIMRTEPIICKLYFKRRYGTRTQNDT